jgi:hypothetical protein
MRDPAVIVHLGHDLCRRDAVGVAELSQHSGINGRVAGQGGKQLPPHLGIGLIRNHCPSLDARNWLADGSADRREVSFIAPFRSVSYLTLAARRRRIRASSPPAKSPAYADWHGTMTQSFGDRFLGRGSKSGPGGAIHMFEGMRKL